MNESGRRDRPPSRGFYALFLLIPLITVGVFGHYALLMEEDHRRSMARRKLEQELDQLIFRADPSIFFSHLFRSLETRIQRKRKAGIEAGFNLEGAISSGPLDFEWYRFDQSGDLIVSSRLDPELVPEKKLVWRILQGYWDGNKDTNRAALRKNLGLKFPQGAPRTRPGEIFPTVSAKGKGLTAMYPCAATGSQAGTLFLMLKQPSMAQMLCSPQIASLGLGFSEPTCVVVSDVIGQVQEVPAPIGVPAGRLQIGTAIQGQAVSFLASLRDQPAGRPLTWAIRRSGDETIRAIRATPASNLSHERFWLRVAILFAAVVLILVFPIVSRLASGIFLSIRWKIPVLFLYAAFIPLMGTILLGHQILRDRREGMAAQVRRRGTELLTQLDADFSLEKARHLKALENFRVEVSKATSTLAIASLARSLKMRKEVSWVEVRNRQARIMVTTWVPDLRRSLEILTSTIAKVSLKRFLPGIVPGDHSLDLKLSEIFIQDFFLSPVSGWPRILERPGELHSIRFTDWDLYLYWSVIASSPTEASFIHSHQQLYWIRGTFARRHLNARTARQHPPFLLVGHRERDGQVFPEDQPASPDLKNFLQRIRIRKEPIHGTISLNGVSYLVTGLPGKHLDEFNLAALYPVSIIDQTMARIFRNVVLGSLLVMLLAIFVGLVITSTFLQPVEELSAGVRALRERDVSRRIDVRTGDELGDLARTFNATLDGLQEILLAHEVQTQFIPDHPPAIPGYSMDLSSRPARDLGGDYCDVQPLPDGNFLFVIGDATGHGVSSALVMTMAKAGVLDFIREKQPPAELLKGLNHLFYTFFKRQIAMTFFACVLEPATGTLTCSGGGQPFPIVFRRDGTTDRIKLPHPPLGFSPRSERIRETEIRLEPGEIVFFFSDFLFEMHDPSGTSWGVKNLIGFIQERCSCEPRELREELFRFAESYTASRDFEDDATVMFLRREVISGAETTR